VVGNSQKLSFFRSYLEGWLQGELNVLVMVVSLKSGYFEREFLIGKFKKIKLPKFLLMCHPLVGLFFLLTPLLLHGFFHQSVQRLLEELAFSQTVADVVLEGDQVLHQFLVGNQRVELVVEDLIRPVTLFVEPLKEFVHEHLPELGGLLDEHIAELAMEILHKVGVQFFLPLRNPGKLQEEFKVDLVGQ
jgi:hypothetical protein